MQADLFPHLEQKNDPIAQCDVLFMAAGTAIHSDSLAGCLRPFITYYRMTYDRISKAAVRVFLDDKGFVESCDSWSRTGDESSKA